MDLYKVILVDDEEEIRQGIKKKIDWSSKGFELIGDASNGIEALEMTKQAKIDVVITDIKMPYMDGIELCREISKISPTTKLVIFSGFDDFKYAKEAIKANVCEYILKPINAEELSAVLDKLKSQIDAEYAEKNNIDKLTQYYNESLPLLKEQFYMRLLEGRIKPSQILPQAEKLQIEFKGPYYVSIIFTPELKQKENHPPLPYSKELIPISIKKMIEEQTNEFLPLNCFLLGNNVVSVAQISQKSEIIHLMSVSERICKIIFNFLKIIVTAGVGYVVESPDDLRKSYLGAFDALDYRVIVGTGGSIFIEDVEPDFSVAIEFNEMDERALYRVVKLGTPEEIRTVIHEVLSKITDSRTPINQYQIFMLELQVSLIKFIKSSQIDIEEILGHDLDNFYNFGNMAEFENWLFERCVAMNKILNKKRTDSSKIITETAKEYILANYADCSLSLEQLCEHLNVSPAYFSGVFKKETSMSFISCLTTVRMEKAAKLLESTNDKTYLIAQQTGYNDPNYFSYVFKKHFGMSPSQYRSEN